MGLAISEHSYCRHALNGLATGGWRSGVRGGGTGNVQDLPKSLESRDRTFRGL